MDPYKKVNEFQGLGTYIYIWIKVYPLYDKYFIGWKLKYDLLNFCFTYTYYHYLFVELWYDLRVCESASELFGSHLI